MPRKDASYKGPAPQVFYNPLLRTLGESTKHTAGVPLTPRSQYHPTLMASGIDPDNCPWEMEGFKFNAAGKKVYKAGVYHRIRRAFIHLQAKGMAARIKGAPGTSRGFWTLTEAGVESALSLRQADLDMGTLTNPILHALADANLYKTKGVPLKMWGYRIVPLMDNSIHRKDALALVEKALPVLVSAGLVQQKKGLWVLTPSGVEKALGIRADYSEWNVTTFWLNSVLPEFYPKMERHLSAKFPRSRDFNEILDLVNNYLTSLMSRDGLRPRIKAGKHPCVSQLCRWAARQACSQFRNEGRDAHTRSFKGALTERDRRHLQSMSEGGPQDLLADTMHSSDLDPIFLQTNSEGRESTIVSGIGQKAPLMDVCGGDLEDEISERLSRSYGFSVIEKVIRRHKQGAPERYVRLARAYMLEGSDINDIARIEGVSRNRAASLVATIRGVLQKAQQEGELKEIPAIFFE